MLFWAWRKSKYKRKKEWLTEPSVKKIASLTLYREIMAREILLKCVRSWCFSAQNSQWLSISFRIKAKSLNDFPFHLDPKLVYPIQSGLEPPWPYPNIVFFPHSTTSLWHSQPGLVHSSPPFLPLRGNFFPRRPHCMCLGIFST